jgi:DNA-binding CsgD family transcriptional regulator
VNCRRDSANLGDSFVRKHQNKSADASISQTFPPATAKVASDVTLADTYVGLCDWHGRLVWKSGGGVRVQVGEFLWKNASKGSSDRMRAAVASVATLREHCTVEVESDRSEHFRVWMWPLDDPDVAICVLAIRIPSELALLSERERSCLRCLAQGKSTREIAKELNIGLTTVHTHLRRSREKLGLTSAEALIGFAARYFFNPEPHDSAEAATARKRSG